MKYEASGVPAAEAEADVVRLWNERAARANDAIFRWGYLASPVGTGHCFLLRATDNDVTNVVGTVGVGVRRVDAGGVTLSAAVLGDFFVLKGHRTFFPAFSMQRAVLTWARKNFDLVYGFPNESAQPIIKRLGFKGMAHLLRYVLVLRHTRYIAARVGSKLAARALALPIDGYRRLLRPGISRRAPRGLTLQRFHRVDERFDRLFETRHFRNLTVGHRDAKLLQWRFLDHPDKPSQLYGLTERTGRLLAYAVVEIENDVAHVRDLLGVDIEAMTQILRLVGGVVRRQGCAALSFTCCAPPDLARGLDRLGFRVRDGGKGPRTLYGHAGDALSNARALSALEHWYATEADEDQ
ncbi:MAG TPA: hypothetical protein VM580_14365 [Labilithrix sp.]|jgi:hypothetical protein|nr:hypothetical protein [Labilithrix sp.]